MSWHGLTKTPTVASSIEPPAFFKPEMSIFGAKGASCHIQKVKQHFNGMLKTKPAISLSGTSAGPPPDVCSAHPFA